MKMMEVRKTLKRGDRESGLYCISAKIDFFVVFFFLFFFVSLTATPEGKKKKKRRAE